jgi:phosphate starvation-inducible protein PhoH and related proteins
VLNTNASSSLRGYNNFKGVTMAKRARKTKNQQHQQGDVIELQNYRRRERYVTIIPRNLRQEDFLDLLDNDNKHIVFAMGPAGTGKTLLAVLAAIRALKEGTCEKIVVTRPAVSVDEQHGFLPGTLVEKMAPWTRPIFDVFEEYWTPQQIEGMIEDGVIEIAPLAYMRGRTFKNSWILADEMQNATPSQMKMLLTRIGTGSRIVVTGDLAQHDRGYENNGLKDFLNHLKKQNNDMFGVVEFGQKDVERHPAVEAVLQIYGDEQV